MGLLLEKNAFTDEGDGVVSFPNGLVITDDSIQKNGTRYDITTMDLSEYKGQLTADHVDRLDSIIGRVSGVAKVGNKVTVGQMKFAVQESPSARLAYNLMRGGYLTDFSIETYGPPPDEQGVYYNAKLVGLSAVVVGNNNNAAINQIALNSIKQAREDGLDTSELEEQYLQTYSVTMNHAEEKESTMDEDTKVEATEVTEETEKTEVAVEETKTEDEKVESVKEENGLAKEIEALKNQVEALTKNAHDKAATEPGFKKETNTMNKTSEIAGMDWRARTAAQVNAAWDYLKGGSEVARNKLVTINELHLEDLKKNGKVSNTMTIGDFGNFVVAREMLTEMEGSRSDYQPLLNVTSWQETFSTQMAWLERDGDIDMQEVEMCDDDANGNLKPISEYDAALKTSNLHELAAVTPVCNAATRFLVSDILGDIAAGYRNDYDRKRAQLVIARLEQAVEATGYSQQYGTTSDVNALYGWLDTMGAVIERAPNGSFVMNYSSYVQLLRRLIGAGINGEFAGLFTTGNQPSILGRPIVVVPNDLMPTLNTAETKTFTVEGVTVTVNHAVFYGDLSTFTGRISGGLQYDLSTDAAYEVGGTVRSAFQRNELVLRGSFFRGGAVRDIRKIAGLRAPGLS